MSDAGDARAGSDAGDARRASDAVSDAAEAPTEDTTEGSRRSVEFHGMAHGGEAVGRLPDGRVVFVDGGLPGERADVLLTEVQPRYARGNLVSMPDPMAAGRIVDPRCPHFGDWPSRGTTPDRWCGACQWQHMDYATQLRHKNDILRDALERIGRLKSPNVLAPIGMDDPWSYRNQIRLHMGEDGLGYLSVDSDRVVPIDVCPITHPLVAELIPIVSDALPEGGEVTLRAGIRTGDQLVVLHASAEDVESIDVDTDVSVALERTDGTIDLVAGVPFVQEVLGGVLFTVPATAFFQVNTLMAERIVELLRESVPAPLDLLVDVHSGVGTFAILLSDLAVEVVAIEAQATAVAAAVENAEGLDHMTILEADAAEGLEFLVDPPDMVVLDPPRSGLDADVVRLLGDIGPDTIAYVSCEPSTLARDTKLLVAAGFTHESSRIVDMFPQTFHIESVNIFRRLGHSAGHSR